MDRETSVPIVNELEQRVLEVFCKFDTLGDKHIHVEDVGLVLRALGCVPSEQDIESFISETVSEQYPGEIHISQFYKQLTYMLLESKMKPNTPEELLEAFKAFDKNCKGFLTKEELIDAVTTGVEPFNEQEVEQMLKASIDHLTDHIPYDFYLRKLAYKPKVSVYDLAHALFSDKKDIRKSVLKSFSN